MLASVTFPCMALAGLVVDCWNHRWQHFVRVYDAEDEQAALAVDLDDEDSDTLPV